MKCKDYSNYAVGVILYPSLKPYRYGVYGDESQCSGNLKVNGLELSMWITCSILNTDKT